MGHSYAQDLVWWGWILRGLGGMGIWRGLVLAGVGLGLGGVATGRVEAQRLPGGVRPEHYSLTITPDLSAATFVGSETIDVVLDAPTSAITLNAAEIEFGAVKAWAGASATATANAGVLPAPASKLAGDPVRSAQNDGVEKAVAGGGEVQPIETALVFGGFSQEAVERFGGQFRALGMTPVAGLGGAAEPGTKQPEPLVPGSAVSAILVRGDLSISGTCTVTYVDPTQLLACGHPITQFGRVSMPMTKAEVVATLASPLNAFKIINTTETVGSFTEDRASAILGRFGVAARMIPVSVEVIPETPDKGAEAAVKQVAAQVGGHGAGLPIPQARHATGMKSGMHFEVLDNRELTPAAMQVSVYQSLSGTNSSADDVSYRMDGEFTLKGLPPVHLDGIMAPSDSMTGAMAAAMYVDDQFSRVYSNAVEQPEVTGLRLKMEQIPERRTAVLEGARLGQTEARAGDTLDVEATLHPYQAEARVVRLKVKLPDSLTPGPLRIVVSDGATLDRLTTPSASPLGLGVQQPMALADVVAQMNRMHANDRIYVTLLNHAAQAELEAEALPSLPISMANVLEPLKTTQRMRLTGESVMEAGSMETGYAVSGLQVLTLHVR